MNDLEMFVEQLDPSHPACPSTWSYYTVSRDGSTDIDLYVGCSWAVQKCQKNIKHVQPCCDFDKADSALKTLRPGTKKYHTARNHYDLQHTRRIDMRTLSKLMTHLVSEKVIDSKIHTLFLLNMEKQKKVVMEYGSSDFNDGMNHIFWTQCPSCRDMTYFLPKRKHRHINSWDTYDMDPSKWQPDPDLYGFHSCPKLSCALTWCVLCKVTPYHHGETCDSFAAKNKTYSKEEKKSMGAVANLCPYCNVYVGKDVGGCDKMTCFGMCFNLKFRPTACSPIRGYWCYVCRHKFSQPIYSHFIEKTLDGQTTFGCPHRQSTSSILTSSTLPETKVAVDDDSPSPVNGIPIAPAIPPLLQHHGRVPLAPPIPPLRGNVDPDQ
jgi:hypothetical protein